MESCGYANAGFVANTGYCSYDTGLARGFTCYEDYTLKKLAFLRTAVFVQGLVRRLFEFGVADQTGVLQFLPEILKEWFFADARKDASLINRSLIDWVDRRPDKARPFFVFLNYMDAHAPYKLPPGAKQRFGHEPRSREEIRIIHESWELIDQLTLPSHYLTMARDAYDNCISHLDEQLGRAIRRTHVAQYSTRP